MVQEGRFREDLYYRINVVELNIPPLRERLEDIPPLCSFFLEKVNEENGYAITGLEEDVLTLFDAYPWPGNVRELEHVIERAAVRCKSGMMTTRHVDFLQPVPAARGSRPSWNRPPAGAPSRQSWNRFSRLWTGPGATRPKLLGSWGLTAADFTASQKNTISVPLSGKAASRLPFAKTSQNFYGSLSHPCGTISPMR